MILLIVTNIIGIFIYFLLRYEGRTDKSKPLSIKFWMKDNWVQLLIIALIDLAIMILLLSSDLTIEKIPHVPEWFASYGDATITLFVGMMLAHIFYLFVKKIMNL